MLLLELLLEFVVFIIEVGESGGNARVFSMELAIL